jgi:carboxymethylenebutenolidase
MQSFLAGADLNSELSGVIGFHGILGGARFGIAGPLDRAAEIGCPLLGLFGGADPAVPTEEVEQFEGRLAEAGVDHEVVVYPGAPHSFFDRHYREHADACEDGWRRVLRFLERNTAAVRA